jgi:hypothetical protein
LTLREPHPRGISQRGTHNFATGAEASLRKSIESKRFGDHYVVHFDGLYGPGLLTAIRIIEFTYTQFSNANVVCDHNPFGYRFVDNISHHVASISPREVSGVSFAISVERQLLRNN